MSVAISPSVARNALKAKALACKNRTRRNLVLLSGVAFGVALAAIYFAIASTADAGFGGLLVAIAIGVAASGVFLFKFPERITPMLANCPSCGHSWEIKEGRSVPYAERMPYWDKCPGCSLPMRTELLQRLAQSNEGGDA